MKKPIIPISDHAVLRYLERVIGVDIEAVRRDIRRKVDLVTAYPGASGILVDGFRYVLAAGAVITVIDVFQPPDRGEAARDDDE